MNKLNKFLSFVDSTNEWVGRCTRWFIILIVPIIVLEVVLRYIFDSPTLWAHELSGYLFTIAAILGGGYVLLHG